VTDVSGFACGGVLLQKERAPDAGWGPFGQVARKLRDAEARYKVTKNEAGAVVFAMPKFRYILLGRPFTVVTDHSALRSLLTQMHGKGRHARWTLAFQEFDFTIKHCVAEAPEVCMANAIFRDVLAEGY
jgi:hypothetical protein